MMRETQEDLAQEAAILDAFCSEWRCTWRKLGNGGKYRIDAVLERNGEVVAWAEVKSHGGSFAGLNVPKYMEMYHLGQLTGVPAFFLLSRGGRLGYITVWDQVWVGAEPTLKVTGGTPAGRKPLPDDIEPMMMFKDSDIKWVKTAVPPAGQPVSA